MTTVDERSTGRQRVVVYLVVGVLLGVLLLAGYLLSRAARANAEAEAKADHLIARLAQEGARAPTRSGLVRLLGTNGGAVCADPAAALARATSANGIATRLVLPRETVVRVQQLVVEVYCPEKLATGW